MSLPPYSQPGVMYHPLIMGAPQVQIQIDSYEGGMKQPLMGDYDQKRQSPLRRETRVIKAGTENCCVRLIKVNSVYLNL